jgi:hypothetical protein
MDANDIARRRGTDALRQVIDNETRSAVSDEGMASHQRPAIRLSGGELPKIVDDAEAALLASGADIYQRGGQLVRPVVEEVPAADGKTVQSWRIVPVTGPHLVERFTSVAGFQAHRRREKEWVPVDCPKDVAEVYLAREGSWRVPPLMGVVNAPMLRVDGSLLDQPGYDRATRLIFESGGCDFPPLPSVPSRRDAERALALLADLVATFPFVGPVDRAVALSGIISAVDRRSVPNTPMHGYSAPVAGSGKTMLVDTCSMIAIGRAAPVIDQSRNQEELEKRLVAAMLRGGLILSIDNCERALESSLLCQALTAAGPLQLRVLGLSRDVEVPANQMTYATGNNLSFSGDLTRRAVICRLDPRCERPELRVFTRSPLEMVRQRRGDYVVAALTVLRAYLISGERASVTPIGSFDLWSRRVREALVWLGCADPCESMSELRGTDPELAKLRALITAWHAGVGEQPITARNLVDLALRVDVDGALSYRELHEALMVVAGHGREIDPARLGRWLGKVVDRVVDGRRIVRDTVYAGSQRWRVAEPDEATNLIGR